MLAVVTFLGVMKVIGLIGALMLVLGLFVYAIEAGGIFGWWMANDMIDIAGHILTAIGEAIGSMKD
jgi:hypothetical protein